MKKLIAVFVSTMLFVVGSVAAQSTAGYADAKGAPLGSGDTQIAWSGIKDGKFTVTLSKLYAYNDAGKRLAEFSKDPKFFEGTTVHVMNLGDMYGDTGALVQYVELKNAIASAPIGADTVTLQLTTGGFDCRPLNWVLSRSGKPFAWLGHPGWATDNAKTGPYTVLAQGEKRYPATVACFKGDKVVPLSPADKARLAKLIQPPSKAVDDQ